MNFFYCAEENNRKLTKTKRLLPSALSDIKEERDHKNNVIIPTWREVEDSGNNRIVLDDFHTTSKVNNDSLTLDLDIIPSEVSSATSTVSTHSRRKLEQTFSYASQIGKADNGLEGIDDNWTEV